MNVRISRVLLSLIFLALLKLAVFGMLSVDSVTLEVAEAVLPQSAIELASPTEAMAQAEKPAQKDAAAGQSDANQAQAAPAPAKPAGAEDLPDDWKALKKLQEQIAIERRNNEELKAFVEAETKRLTKLRDEIKNMLEEAKATKDKKVKQLVDMLSSTKAKQAAKILESMDQDLAVKVLSGMRGRTAGEILTFVEAKKAAQFSEALTRLQVPFEEQ
ncbi:MotE family protein [Salidesulfovibrio onnuriiensis]|uniref:MotE family protein n=1 Tax=Salidesulfovibrio onnuriiensis TaxID=2583823 RepID=UPI0011C73759|nr:magnesium transporter MgtE [Salidesulfovibrio onnuriiensis]